MQQTRAELMVKMKEVCFMTIFCIKVRDSFHSMLQIRFNDNTLIGKKGDWDAISFVKSWRNCNHRLATDTKAQQKSPILGTYIFIEFVQLLFQIFQFFIFLSPANISMLVTYLPEHGINKFIVKSVFCNSNTWSLGRRVGVFPLLVFTHVATVPAALGHTEPHPG